MWFNPEDDQRDFENGIFSYNPWSFAYHLEPEGFRSLFSLKAPQQKHYEKFVPRTVEIAKGMYERIPQRRNWGTQIGPGRWSFEKYGQDIKTKNGTRRGQALSLRDVLKHLTGRSGYARGTTDIPIPHFRFSTEAQQWRPNYVRNLRLDVDQNNLWEYEAADRIDVELRAQKRVIEAAGLPYRVFRTGSRGVQLVIPLPIPVPQCFASMLLHGLRSALEARGKGYAAAKEIDKDNLISLMRLPGGVHASSGNLGLWIDVDQAQLYLLEEQARMMVDAFDYPSQEPHCITRELFIEAGVPILRRMRQSGIALHDILDRDQSGAFLRERPHNPISQAIERAYGEALKIKAEREAEMVEWRKSWLTPANTDIANDGNERQVELTTESISSTRTLAPAIAISEAQEETDGPFGSVEWARNLWIEAYCPGGHWEWVSMSGKKGILAALILFGESGAEQALLDLAGRIPARSQSERREREHTIRALWQGFGWKHFKTYDPKKAKQPSIILGAATLEVNEVARQIVAEMVKAQPKPRWRQELAFRVCQVLLIGIRDSESGRLRISYGTITEMINQRWSEDSTNKQRVSEMVPRITQAEGSLVRAFFRIPGRRWASEPDEYGCGRFLRGTLLQLSSTEKLKEFMEKQYAEFGDDDPDEEPVVVETA